MFAPFRRGSAGCARGDDGGATRTMRRRRPRETCVLEHDPEKHALGLDLGGSCSNKKLERDVDRTITYPALAATLPCQRENIASRRPYLCLAPRYFGSRVT